MRSASSVPSQPKISLQSDTRDGKSGSTQIPTYTTSANERRVLQDDDDVLSFLPQGTTVTDAEVDALLKELEKPLPRTTKRSYFPSSRARNDPLPLPTMPKDRPQAPGEPAKYDPDAMLSRNLVSEAAKAIGVSPTPRKFAPRMRLNKRSTEEIMKERRARLEKTENDRKNDELFDTLGLSNMKISDEEAEAFLTKGIIPSPQKQTRSSHGGNANDHFGGDESLQDKNTHAFGQNKNVSAALEDPALKEPLAVEQGVDGSTFGLNTEPETLEESKLLSPDINKFEEAQIESNARGSGQETSHEDGSQAAAKSKMELVEEKDNKLDSRETLTDDHEFAPIEATIPNNSPKEAQPREEAKSQLVEELEALNEANMRDSSFVSEVSLCDKKDNMDVSSKNEVPANSCENDTLDAEQTMSVPFLDGSSSPETDSTKLNQSASMSDENRKDPGSLSPYIKEESADLVPESNLHDDTELSGSTKEAALFAEDANEQEYHNDEKCHSESEKNVAFETKKDEPADTLNRFNEPKASNQDNSLNRVHPETNVSQESENLEFIKSESSDQEDKGTLISEVQTELNQPEDETRISDARPTNADPFAENGAMETSLHTKEPGCANDNATSPTRELHKALSNEATTETCSETDPQRLDENPKCTVSNLQSVDFASKEPTRESENFGRTVQEQTELRDVELTKTMRSENAEKKASLDDKMHDVQASDALGKEPLETAALNASHSPIPDVSYESDVTICHERDEILHANAQQVHSVDSCLNSSSRRNGSCTPIHADDNFSGRHAFSSSQDAISSVPDLSTSEEYIPSTMEHGSNPSNIVTPAKGSLSPSKDASSTLENVLNSSQEASSSQDILLATETLSTEGSLPMEAGMASKFSNFVAEGDQHGTENASCSIFKKSTLEASPSSMNSLPIQNNHIMQDEERLNEDISNARPTDTALEHVNNDDIKTKHSVSSDKSMHLASATVPSLVAGKKNLDEQKADVTASTPTTMDLPRDHPDFHVNDGDPSMDRPSKNLQELSATDTESLKEIDPSMKSQPPHASDELSYKEFSKEEKTDTLSQMKGLSSDIAERSSSVQQSSASNPATPRESPLDGRPQRPTKASPVSPVANLDNDKDTRSPLFDEDGNTTMLIHTAGADEKDSDESKEILSKEDAKDAMNQSEPSATLPSNDEHTPDAARVSGLHTIPDQDADACNSQVSTELIQPCRRNASGSIGETSHGSDSEYESEGDVPDLWIASARVPPTQDFSRQDTSLEQSKKRDDSSVQDVSIAPGLDSSTPTDPICDADFSVRPASNEQDLSSTSNNLAASITDPHSLLPENSTPEENDIRSTSVVTTLSADRKSPSLPRCPQDDRDVARRTVSEAPRYVDNIKSTSKDKNDSPRRTLSDIMHEADQILQEWK